MLEEKKKKNPRKKKPNILLINTAVPKCALDHSARFGSKMLQCSLMKPLRFLSLCACILKGGDYSHLCPNATKLN